MCGIIGYLGKRNAQPILLNCLKKLEYRGYDSCGLAIKEAQNIRVFKDKGRIAELEKRLPETKGKIGIAHTRWATHGEPSPQNAHPHVDCTGKIALVHNGVIAQFLSLKEKLISRGHLFRSQTDTEVIAHLIEESYHGDLMGAVTEVLRQVDGSYSLIIMHQHHDLLIVARNQTPLVIGPGDGEFFIASDVVGILEYVTEYFHLEDGDVGVISPAGVRLFNNGQAVERHTYPIPWSAEEAQKGGHEHFMLKEIHEQPKVVEQLIREYLPALEDGTLLDTKALEQVLLLGCGTSYHAALIGKQLMEKLANIVSQAEVASEVIYSPLPLPANTLAIALTQSGETADTVKAFKKAKERGCFSLAITNRVGSLITKIAQQTLYLRAGPEVCVAATKSFLAQLFLLYLLALSLAKVDAIHRRRLVSQLREIPGKIEQVLEKEDHIAQYGSWLADYEKIFLIARGINLPVALEGALKFSEIAYIHAQGYSAGELKHGPFALLTPQVPVIGVVSRDETYEVLLSNIQEVKARGSPVIGVVPERDEEAPKYVDIVIRVPEVDPLFSPLLNTVVLQLLSYYAARKRGCPIDMPRNLAKSVTVE